MKLANTVDTTSRNMLRSLNSETQRAIAWSALSAMIERHPSLDDLFAELEGLRSAYSAHRYE